MLHPATELRPVSPEVGLGVFATGFIPKGTIVWVLDALDHVLAPAQVAALPAPLRAQVERYGYVDPNGDYVLCWDFSRYMNHGCAPTSRGVGDAFEVAIRDIAPGEQLTCEYGTLNLSTGFTCRCGSPNCRGAVGPEDLSAHWERWDAEAAEAFALARTVPQPLVPFAKLGARDAQLLDALAAGDASGLPSCRDYQVVAPLEGSSGAAEGAGLWSLSRHVEVEPGPASR